MKGLSITGIVLASIGLLGSLILLGESNPDGIIAFILNCFWLTLSITTLCYVNKTLDK